MNVLTALLLLALSLPAAAQGGGFDAGELFVYTNSLTSPGYVGSGILRVNPVTGASSVLLPTWGAYDFTGAMAFDPYRQRLVFCSAITGTDPGPVRYLWLADGAGNLLNLTKGTPLGGASFNSIAPTRDGRIYTFVDTDTISPIRWIDAANEFHVLYDSDGVTPMKIDGNGAYTMNGMIHDAATNALFVASTMPAPGFPLAAVNVRKLPLSADGSRVVGPVGNSTFEVSPNPPAASSWETPRGWSYGPNGKLVLCILTIDAEVLPRMLLVDPVTSAISVWGSNGDPQSPTGESTNTAGAYSSTLGKVVLFDFWNTKLRAYSQGSTGGPGAAIITSPASLAPNAYYLNITAIPPDDCGGAWVAYGAGLKGAGNLVPKLYGTGCPEPGAIFDLKIDQVVGGAGGALFVGLASAALPFKGGSLLVAPITLQVAIGVGGAPGVAGAGALTLPAFLPSDPGLTGLSIFLQAAFGDGAAVKHVSLTQGLEMEIG